jgi:rapamycin-insensitive companion of mTOR
MFFNLLKIKTPEWYQSFISGRRLTSMIEANLINTQTELSIVYRRSRGPETKRDEGITIRPSESFRLTDQYIALLIMVFTNAGLLEVCEPEFAHPKKIYLYYSGAYMLV